jgi:hypothetical protein
VESEGNEAAERTSSFSVADFKTGYADGFTTGVAAMAYPDQTTLSGRSADYVTAFNQGYSDGQNEQSGIRERLCYVSENNVGAAPTSGSYSSSSYSSSQRSVATSRTLGARVERVDPGIGSTARKAILIGAGAATGAGIGAAVGGKKGAGIGALIGGGTGTALALTKQPNRAFNRRVTTKSVVTKTLIGAGAGAAIGALTGGKRGAAAGAALGGGGGAIWSLIDGRRVRQ